MRRNVRGDSRDREAARAAVAASRDRPSQRVAHQKESVRQAFHRFDINSDGLLHPGEFIAILRALKYDDPGGTFKQLFDAADVDNSGTLSIDEFMDYLFQEENPLKSKLLEDPDCLKPELVLGTKVEVTRDLYMEQAKFKIEAGSQGRYVKVNASGSVTIDFKFGRRNVLASDFTALTPVRGAQIEVGNLVEAIQAMYTEAHRIECGWTGTVLRFNDSASATIEWTTQDNSCVRKNVLPQDFVYLKKLPFVFHRGAHVQARDTMYSNHPNHIIEKGWTGVCKRQNESGSVTIHWYGQGDRNVLPAEFAQLECILAPLEIDTFVRATSTMYESQDNFRIEVGWQGQVVRLNESGSATICWVNIDENRNVLAADFGNLIILPKDIELNAKVEALKDMYRDKFAICAGWHGTVEQINDSGSATVAWQGHGRKNVLRCDFVKLRLQFSVDGAKADADVEEKELLDDPDIMKLELIDDENILRKIQRLMHVSDPHNLGIGRDVRASNETGFQGTYTQLKVINAWKITQIDKQLVYDAKKRIVNREMRLLRIAMGGPFVLQTKLDDISKDEGLDGSVNEKLLLHGTKCQNVCAILMNGMNERLSGGLFGKGIYLAEDPSKMDQYTTPDDGQSEDSDVKMLHRRLYRNGQAEMPTPEKQVFYALGVRVVMGRPVFTKDGETDMNGRGTSIWARGDRRELSAIPNVAPPIHWHSLVADTGGKVQRHREFITFDGDRTIVSYLIAYSRV